MSSVNKVILIGNVGSDPDVRYLDRGVAIANFNLATTERGYTMQNGTQVPDKTDWHSIVLWRNLAEWAERNIRKSMKLYVEGKLQTRTWEKDGQRRSKTEVIAENIQILYRPQEYQQQQNETIQEEEGEFDGRDVFVSANDGWDFWSYYNSLPANGSDRWRECEKEKRKHYRGFFGGWSRFFQSIFCFTDSGTRFQARICRLSVFYIAFCNLL